MSTAKVGDKSFSLEVTAMMSERPEPATRDAIKRENQRASAAAGASVGRGVSRTELRGVSLSCAQRSSMLKPSTPGFSHRARRI